MKIVIFLLIMFNICLTSITYASNVDRKNKIQFRYDLKQIEFMDGFPGEHQSKRTEVMRIDHHTGEAQVLKMKRQSGRWVYFWVNVESPSDMSTARRSSNVPLQF